MLFKVFAAGRDEKPPSSNTVVPKEFEFIFVAVFDDDDEGLVSANELVKFSPNAFPPNTLPALFPKVVLDELFEVLVAHGSAGMAVLVTADAGVLVVAQGFANDEEIF